MKAAKVYVKMKNIALIYFTGDSDKGANEVRNNILFRGDIRANFGNIIRLLFGIFQKLKRAFKGSSSVIEKKIEIDSNLGVYIIKLPIKLSKLNKSRKFVRNKAEKLICKICMEKSIDRCIVPTHLKVVLKNCKKSSFTGNITYNVLGELILKDICEKKGYNIREIDIAVIQGEDDVLPYIVIKLLSPIVKFITLVTNYREKMNNKLEELCDDTGLSVRITNDVESVLENCDLVINYGNVKSSNMNNKIKSKAIVINYGEFEDTLLEDKNTVINGIDIDLGKKYLDGFEKDIYKFYSPIEIAEIILTSKFHKCINSLYDLADYIVVDSFKNNFLEEGFLIQGYL